MLRSSLLRRPLGFLLGTAVLLLGHGAARAQNSTPVKFDTKDGVILHGTLYPGKSARVRDEPAILMLHRYRSDSHQDGWDALAVKLQEKGFTVLSFDFRGHGKSTSVDGRTFWSFPFNQRYVRGFNPAKPRGTINLKEFLPGYQPYLVNDIAAAKLFLDERNDAGECNSRSLVVIGAEEGATLGALWMYGEWHRHPATVLEVPQPLVTKVDQTETEGKDQYAAVWLSISPALGGRSVDSLLRRWLKYAGQEKKVPMAFVHGQEERAMKLAQDYVRLLKGSDKEALRFTLHQDVKTKLSGAAMLRPELGTAEWIADKYLSFLKDKNTPARWSRREPVASAWYFPANGLGLVAKTEKGRALEPMPVERFGLVP